MTRSERGCFIEKEQLGPAAWLHQFPVHSLVLKQTKNPAARLVESPDFP
jgi:hypothetical protein